MSQWIFNGIRNGIKTTVYPYKPETAAGVSPGLPDDGDYDITAATTLERCCPTHVFNNNNGHLEVDVTRCIHCRRCQDTVATSAHWNYGNEGTIEHSRQNEFPRAFSHSVHICVVDAGGCGACLNEIRQLNNPYYNMHRLGLFITPSPRHADLLLVVGALTDHMRFALKKAYDAMPTPKRIVAVGSCALSGGIFADSCVCAKGVSEILPVDVEIPGSPPSPLAILHGLLTAVGRKPTSLPKPSSERE